MEEGELQLELEGMSTRLALSSLHDDIDMELRLYKSRFNASRWRIPFWVFRLSNTKSSFHWTSILLIVFCSISLLVTFGIPHSAGSEFSRDAWLPVEALVLLAILVVNCYLTGLDYTLEKEETVRLIQQVLNKIKECMKTCTWNVRNYPDISSPQSPGVSLQWTLREGDIVNMPTALLVQGDIILLRPGQHVPAKCRGLDDTEGSEDITLGGGEVFSPDADQGSDHFSLPQGRTPLQAKKFLLLETPFIKNLRAMLESECERPVSVVDNERYHVCTVWLESRVVPVIFVLMVVVNVLRYVYLRESVGTWAEIILVLPVHALLPLLPLMFPVLWKVFNYFGQARLFTAFEVSKETKVEESASSFDSASVISADEARVNMDWRQVLRWMTLIMTGCSPTVARQANIMHVMGSVTSFCCVDKKGLLSWPNPTAEKVFFLTRQSSTRRTAKFNGSNPGEEGSTESTDHHTVRKIKKKRKSGLHNYHAYMELQADIERHHRRLFTVSCQMQDSGSLQFSKWRQKFLGNGGFTTILDLAAYMELQADIERYNQRLFTVSCQMQDSGGLQFSKWRQKSFGSGGLTTILDLAAYMELQADIERYNRRSFSVSCQIQDSGSFQNGIHMDQECHIEVLDLTHDYKTTFGLQFDDLSWKKNLGSLKPLGLNILLNTCNHSTKVWYSKFTDHVACSALKNKETVAVVNRRCLCELARQIGFSEKAGEVFDLEHCLGMYKQVPAEEADKERIHRAHSFVQHKIPMPNMVSVAVKEATSGSRQLMSQGTADIILDRCSDYWDGHDLRTLLKADRKKILDFYHRTSMASYCTAFSYRPLSGNIADHLQNHFIELPEHCPSLHPPPHPFDTCSLGSLTPEGSSLDLPRAFSADSLMGEEGSVFIDDVSGCYTAQSNQVFIGMVTMQYQARQDIVQLIDQLDTACIRFVHFCEENELRSRVFSEKMGLEAGWNCHISLLPYVGDSRLSNSPEVSQGEISQSQHTSKYLCRHSTNTLNNRDSHTAATVKLQEESTQCMAKSYSAPSFINMEATQVKFYPINQVTSSNRNKDDHWPLAGDHYHEANESSCLICSPGTDGHEQHGTTTSSSDEGQDVHSDSHRTSSYITVNTDDSLTGMLDNRAKLPQGIDDIRPHLENVDNVPLLVSLFTDCTPPATCEMMRIMQEYGEVVLCLGSSLNIHNTGIFLQANASIAVQPRYPHLCAKHEVMVDPWEEDQCSPMQLASTLLSVPCSLWFRREDNVHFVQLIAEARNYLLMMRNCFQFLLCCCLTVSLVQVLSSLLLLPPVLAGRHLLWLVCLVVPTLSFTLMANQVDTRIMTEATGKNCKHISTEVVIQFLLYYGLRFIPSVAVCLFCFGVNCHAICVSAMSNQTACLHIQQRDLDTDWNPWQKSYVGGVSLVQNFLLFQIVLYFVLISVSYVYKYKHLWRSPPFTNKYWLVVSMSLLVCQVIYFSCDVSVYNQYGFFFSLTVLPVVSWVTALGWPVLLVALNELIKMQEIKLWVRYQKRSRLNFGTKLGMNSPF